MGGCFITIPSFVNFGHCYIECGKDLVINTKQYLIKLT